MERACHRLGKSMWASFHSSEGKRLHRNTEGGHKLTLDMVPQAASSPAGSEKKGTDVISGDIMLFKTFWEFSNS